MTDWVRVATIAIAGVCAIPSLGIADRAGIDAARKILNDEAAYDRVQDQLTATLHRGDNTPNDLIQIYSLAGIASVVLGHDDVAESYFRRWLALAPNAKLPDGVAPKIAARFANAQAHMAALGPLRASGRRGSNGVLIIEIAGDPLNMVSGARVHWKGQSRPTQVPRTNATASIRVVTPAQATPERIELVDEFGNVVQQPVVDMEQPVTSRNQGRDSNERELPLYRRWQVWAGSAAVAGAVGLGFAVAGDRAHQQLNDILAHPGDHVAADARDASSSWKRNFLVANTAFVTAGVFVAASVTTWVLGRNDRAVVAMPVVSPQTASLAIATAW